MKAINPIIRLLPFVMLMTSVLASLITNTKLYTLVYPYLSQIIGYSLGTNLYFLYFSFRLNMCMYVKISIYGLLSLNFLDLIYPLIPNYYDIYSDISSFTFFGLATLYLLIEYGRNRH